MNRQLFRLVFVTLLSIMAASPLHAQSQGQNFIDCDKPGQAANLRAAINNAEPGSTLTFTGTCVGPFFINKQITLAGSGSATLSVPPGSTSNVVTVSQGAATFRDLRVDATGSSNHGISVSQNSSIVVVDVDIENAVGPGSSGIFVTGASSALVVDSRLSNNRFGLHIVNASHGTSVRNLIEDSLLAGIEVIATSSLAVRETDILDGVNGLLVGVFSHADLLGGNVLEGNSSFGVFVKRLSNLFLGGVNTIQANGTDVGCDALGTLGGVLQNSTTKTTAIDPDCLVRNPPIFLP